MESAIIDGDNPVCEINNVLVCILSTAEQVEFCGNLPGPSGKAKYSLVTDSEPVPWGKGEKNPSEGSEKNLKPCAYKRWESFKDDRVPFA